MKSFIEKARKIHRNQKGFTLIELLVVMVILAILVGLVVPNLFGITDEAEVHRIIRESKSLQAAVFMYNQDTGEWPREWSGYPITTRHAHQLWFADRDAVGALVPGWDGPYIDRPILQRNSWGGHWGVRRARLNFHGADNRAPAGGRWVTVLEHRDVPERIAIAVDRAMDDGVRTTGAVQYGGSSPDNHYNSGGAPDDTNVMMIILAGAR